MSELILAAPSSDPTIAAVPPRSPRWGFWTTCAWGIGALAGMSVAQIAATFVFLLWWADQGATLPENAKAAASHAVVVSVGELVGLPVMLLILALAVRLARARFADYLALKPIDPKTFLVALGCTLCYGAAVDILSYAAGRGLSVPFVQDLYRTARESGTLALVLIAVVVVAPVIEELLFRGFLLRGWAAPRLGVAGAIALTSAIWAGIHVQYDWVVISEIFGLGLLFGYLRVRSRSTVTTVLMHGIYGLAAMIQAAIIAG